MIIIRLLLEIGSGVSFEVSGLGSKADGWPDVAWARRSNRERGTNRGLIVSERLWRLSGCGARGTRTHLVNRRLAVAAGTRLSLVHIVEREHREQENGDEEH